MLNDFYRENRPRTIVQNATIFTEKSRIKYINILIFKPNKK